jgi:hypothetical protein
MNARLTLKRVAVGAICAALAAGSAHAEPIATPTLHERAAAADAAESMVEGAVCRRAWAATGRPRYVRIDQIAASGEIVASRLAPIRGMPGYRGGCGFYSARQDVIAGAVTRVTPQATRTN